MAEFLTPNRRSECGAPEPMCVSMDRRICKGWPQNRWLGNERGQVRLLWLDLWMVTIGYSYSVTEPAVSRSPPRNHKSVNRPDHSPAAPRGISRRSMPSRQQIQTRRRYDVSSCRPVESWNETRHFAALGKLLVMGLAYEKGNCDGVVVLVLRGIFSGQRLAEHKLLAPAPCSPCQGMTATGRPTGIAQVHLSGSCSFGGPGGQTPGPGYCRKDTCRLVQRYPSDSLPMPAGVYVSTTGNEYSLCVGGC